MSIEYNRMSESSGVSNTYGNPSAAFGQGQPNQPPQTIMYNNQLHSVLVAQPIMMTVTTAPNTTFALVFNTLGALLCGFVAGAIGIVAGAIGIVFSWKARMYVLKQRYEEANHSIRVAWVFFFLCCMFGILIRSMALLYLTIMFR